MTNISNSFDSLSDKYMFYFIIFPIKAYSIRHGNQLLSNNYLSWSCFCFQIFIGRCVLPLKIKASLGSDIKHFYAPQHLIIVGP